MSHQKVLRCCLKGMNIKTGISRGDNINICLDACIKDDNVVRVIDAFVDALDLEKLGFTRTTPKKEGRPIYQAKDMLKLYYYGYLNAVRSSRKLEAQCEHNIDVWWLIRQLKPRYHTIADFRKDNAEHLPKVFKLFVSFLKGEEVFGKELLVVDGTKIRAQNNKRNNYNEKKLEKLLKYIEGKEAAYIKELQDFDIAEDLQAAAREDGRKQIEKQQQILQQRKEKYEGLQKSLEESGELQISTVDSNSRSLPIKDRITNVCYNVQAVVDSKHSLIVEFDTINTTDQGQLCPMITKGKKALGVKEIIGIADAGYYVGKDLADCKREGITTIVAPGEHNNPNIDPAYQKSEFSYDKEQDCYTCPQGAILTTNGKEYEKKKKGRETYNIKKYVTDLCLSCIARAFCTRAQSREITRSEYQDVKDENNKRVENNPELYKRRQEIIEHIFGTVKRGLGYTYTLLKGIKKVNGEVAIIFTMYNVRRAMSIIGVKELISRLKSWEGGKSAFLKVIWSGKAYGQLIAA